MMSIKEQMSWNGKLIFRDFVFKLNARIVSLWF